MARVHDIMAVHGVGEQRRGDTLIRFAEQFYKGVRWLVQEAGQDPNQVQLLGFYRDNQMEVHYRGEIFRLWEISWERSFRAPSAGDVLDWLQLWSSQYLSRAFWQLRGQETHRRGRGIWPRTWWLLILILNLTLVVPLLVALYWMWTARALVKYQLEHNDHTDTQLLVRHRFATGLALTIATPLIVTLNILARLARLVAAVPVIGVLAKRLGQTIEDLVVGSLGDILLYVFDPIQASFIRGDLEQAISEAHAVARQEGREPRIHVIGHSMGSVIAYEAVSASLPPSLRRSVKTLCTMGTVLDMVRYVLEGGGLVLAERLRFGYDIPREQQGEDYPHWLNLFARNDPAPGFSPLVEFGTDPMNRPVCSTSEGHSTYWPDVQGVYRPFLSWVAAGNPIFDKKAPRPPASCQNSLWQDAQKVSGKLLLLILIVAATALFGAWRLDIELVQVPDQLDQLLGGTALPWPLSWIAAILIWIMARLIDLVLSLPQWYLRWLIWVGIAFLAWFIFSLPTIFKTVWRWIEQRRRVPIQSGAELNYWVGVLSAIGPLYEVALRKKDIWTVHDFLVTAVRPGGVGRLAHILHASQDWILQSAQQANLMRLRGVGPQQAVLLIASGIDSLQTLGQSDRTTLLKQMQDQAQQAGLSDLPTEQELQFWISACASLKDVI